MDENSETVKSANDSCNYRAITLENNLRALLVCESADADDDDDDKDDASMAAASLCLGIGSFSDPENLQGLGHFTEHMLFMGSGQFPGESDFDRFLKEHGGSTNGETYHDQTVFYFDIANTHLKPALERFSQFFINPLLNKDSMIRERNVVDAEWSSKAQDDDERFDQLLSSLSKDGHPLRKFSTGNSSSLDSIPRQNNVNVHEALKIFQQQNYLSQFMTLVVQSKESLDVLEGWIRELFKDVPSNDIRPPNFAELGAPFETPEFRRVYRIIPVKNIRQLQVTWALPCQLEQYRKKPLFYIGNMIGNESDGSLLALLRKRNLARSIQSGNDESSFEHNVTCALFSITLSLTAEGLKNISNVITLIQQYINMLRSEGPQQNLWQEMSTINQNDFRWIELPDPQKHCRQLSMNMHRYSQNDVIRGGKIMTEYDAQLIASCLDQLQYDRMNVALWAKSFQDDPDMVFETEPWFKTLYQAKDIPDDWKQQWSGCGTTPEFFLPRPNVFIASSFQLKDTESCRFRNFEAPLHSTDANKLWYRPDDEFQVPRGFINFCVRSAVVDESPTALLLNDVYVKTLEHLVSADSYPAIAANLNCDIEVADRGLVIRLNGFSEKLMDLFVIIIDQIAAFAVTESLFNGVREEVNDLYENQSLCPETLNKELTKTILLSRHCSFIQKRKCLANISMDQLRTFAKAMYQSCFVEGLIQGNFTSNEAKAFESYLVEKLNVECAESADNRKALAETNITQIPIGCSAYKTLNVNKSDENSVLTSYYQFGMIGLHTQVLNELVVKYMDGPAFDQIRTQMQLGYDIQTEHSSIFNVFGFQITLCSQASKFTLPYLDHMLENFLEYFDTNCVQTISQDQFENLVENAINDKSGDDASLEDQVTRNWSEILGQTYWFGRGKLEAEELTKITLDEFRDWSRNHLLPNAHRRKLSLQPKDSGDLPKELSKTEKRKVLMTDLPLLVITDIEKFKLKSKKYNFTRL